MGIGELFNKYLQKKKSTLLKIYEAGKIPKIKKIPTGILVFDYLTGGGIPVGMITEFVGRYSSGKTTIAYKVANAFLEAYPKKEVLFLDFEGAFDVNWASHFIPKKNINRFFVVAPTYAEEGFDLIIHLVESKASVSLFIVDSLAAATPMAEADGEVADQQVGLQARVFAKFFRKYILANSISESDFTLLVTNQIRSKVGRTPFGQTTGPAGGFAHEHAAALIVRLYSKEIIKKADVPIRQVFSMTIEKTKVGGFPKRSAEFQLCLANYNSFAVGEPYEIKTIMTLMKGFGWLNKEGKTYKILGHEFTNQASIEEKIMHDRQFRLSIKQKLLEEICSN